MLSTSPAAIKLLAIEIRDLNIILAQVTREHRAYRASCRNTAGINKAVAGAIKAYRARAAS